MHSGDSRHRPKLSPPPPPRNTCEKRPLSIGTATYSRPHLTKQKGAGVVRAQALVPSPPLSGVHSVCFPIMAQSVPQRLSLVTRAWERCLPAISEGGVAGQGGAGPSHPPSSSSRACTGAHTPARGQCLGRGIARGHHHLTRHETVPVPHQASHARTQQGPLSRGGGVQPPPTPKWCCGFRGAKENFCSKLIGAESFKWGGGGS